MLSALLLCVKTHHLCERRRRRAALRVGASHRTQKVGSWLKMMSFNFPFSLPFKIINNPSTAPKTWLPVSPGVTDMTGGAVELTLGPPLCHVESGRRSGVLTAAGHDELLNLTSHLPSSSSNYQLPGAASRCRRRLGDGRCQGGTGVNIGRETVN